MLFVGLDLGWSGHPSGLALLRLRGTELTLKTELERVAGEQNVLNWLDQRLATAPAMISIDAPLIITNESGQRPVETCIGRSFARYEAGCHSSNMKSSFAAVTTDVSKQLAKRGFVHAPSIAPRRSGRYQIEVYPHPATIRLFALAKTLKYKRKRGRTFPQCCSELQRFRDLILVNLSRRVPKLSLEPQQLPQAPDGEGWKQFKAVEDQLDALLCAYIGAHWWYWGDERNTVYGDQRTGYIVVPEPTGEP